MIKLLHHAIIPENASISNEGTVYTHFSGSDNPQSTIVIISGAFAAHTPFRRRFIN
jgi:hypothetical protein